MFWTTLLLRWGLGWVAGGALVLRQNECIICFVAKKQTAKAAELHTLGRAIEHFKL